MKKEELNALLQDMPLEEKVNQMLQIVGFIYLQNDSDILTGPARNMGLTKDNVDLAGSILGTFGADNLIKIQKNQMEKQPHHIPPRYPRYSAGFPPLFLHLPDKIPPF